MAVSIGGIYATLGANVAGWTAGMNRAKADITGLQNATSAATSRITGAVSAMMTQVAGAAGLVGGIGTIGFGVKLAAEMEQTQIAFEGLLGSSEAAKKHIADLQQFAASTPFNFRDLVQLDRQMLAVGLKSNDTIGTLRILGDAVAALGGDGETIGRVVKQMSDMNSKGKVSAAEMKVLAEAGIPAWQLLADKIGVDVPKAMAMAESGAIRSGLAIDAILSGLNEKFGGSMKRQSDTLGGVFSNLVDVTQQKLTIIGAEIAKTFNFKQIIKSTTEFINKVGPGLETVAKHAKNFTVALAGLATYAIAGRAVEVALWGIANASKAAAAGAAFLQALTSPAGLVKIAAAGAAAAGVMWAMDRVMGDAAAGERAMAATADKLAESEKKSAAAMDAAKKSAASLAGELKASEAAGRRMKLAEETIAAMVTPTEVLKKKTEDLQALLATGKLTWAQYDAGMKAAAKTYDDATSKSGELIKSLEDEIATYGLTGRQLQILQAQRKGASPDALRKMFALDEQLSGFERINKSMEEAKKHQAEMMEEGKRIAEDAKSPLEKYGDYMEKLKGLTAAGALTIGQAEASAKKLRAEIERPYNYQGVAAMQRGSQEALSFENQIREQAKFKNVNRLQVPKFENFANELEQQQAAARNAIGGGIKQPPGQGGNVAGVEADKATGKEALAVLQQIRDALRRPDPNNRPAVVRI